MRSRQCLTQPVAALVLLLALAGCAAPSSVAPATPVLAGGARAASPTAMSPNTVVAAPLSPTPAAQATALPEAPSPVPTSTQSLTPRPSATLSPAATPTVGATDTATPSPTPAAPPVASPTRVVAFPIAPVFRALARDFPGDFMGVARHNYPGRLWAPPARPSSPSKRSAPTVMASAVPGIPSFSGARIRGKSTSSSSATLACTWSSAGTSGKFSLTRGRRAIPTTRIWSRLRGAWCPAAASERSGGSTSTAKSLAGWGSHRLRSDT